jgi:glycosyltransferase involved in cell wall biosynthesis
VCMVHGIPCVANQGWPKTLAILASARLGNASRGVQLVEVSEYAALHMREIFGVRVDAVVHNPLRPLFLEAAPPIAAKREAIVYAGRLHRSKKVDRLLPAIRDALDENQGLRAWIIGDGPLRPELERIAAGDDRIEFFGTLPPIKVRDLLRRARVFVSGCPTEALGIAYMEALSQGCAVVMPASGGGLEIAPELIGSRIELFPISMSREQVVAALRKALLAPARETQLATYSPRAVAAAYLAVDARFDVHGIFEAQAGGSPTSSLGTRCVAGHG